MERLKDKFQQGKDKRRIDNHHLWGLLMMLQHLRSLGPVSKLRLLRVLPADIFKEFLDRSILVESTDELGLTVYKVSDDVFNH